MRVQFNPRKTPKSRGGGGVGGGKGGLPPPPQSGDSIKAAF